MADTNELDRYTESMSLKELRLYYQVTLMRHASTDQKEQIEGSNDIDPSNEYLYIRQRVYRRIMKLKGDSQSSEPKSPACAHHPV